MHIIVKNNYNDKVTLSTGIFPRKKIPSAFRFFFAYFAVAAASAGLSVVRVYTGSLKWRATVSHRGPHSQPLPEPFLCLCLNTYLVFIRAPSTALLLCTSTSFAGRASLPRVVWKTWKYLLFKGLVPYAVLVVVVEGGGKGVCFGREADAGLTLCH